MDIAQMLHQMCHEVLSNADIKAIVTSRGFSAKEAASRALFENFFLSDIGLEAAFDRLKQEEVILLHMLNCTGEIVDVSFFARVYGGEGQTYYGTFHQRYNEVFNAVRRSLIRKGLLLIAEVEDPKAKSKLERWRFRFPQGFARFLPPPLPEAKTLAGRGEVRSEAPRRKLLEVAEGKQASPLKANPAYEMRLVGGELRMGDKPFRAQYLLDWQRACWEAALPPPEKKARAPLREKRVSPVEASMYILSQLGENEWIHPEQLSSPLKIFSQTHLRGEEICVIGWYWGCLARQQLEGVAYYRLPHSETDPDVEPIYYFHAEPDRPMVVNLETVPYQALEQLGQIARLKVGSPGPAYPLAQPDLIKMGNAPPSVWAGPLVGWLRENVPAFQRAFKTVKQRWGKQIIHQNLLLAKVNDLALKVQLERAFPEKVVFLPNDYLAFPQQLLAEIEKVLANSGHVIRTIYPDD